MKDNKKHILKIKKKDEKIKIKIKKNKEKSKNIAVKEFDQKETFVDKYRDDYNDYSYVNSEKEYDNDLDRDSYTKNELGMCKGISSDNKIKGRNRISSYEVNKTLKEKYKIIFLNNQLYFYESKLGYYKDLSEHETKVKIRTMLTDKEKTYLKEYDLEDSRRLLITDPDIQIESLKKDKNSGLINCLNCVLDLENGNRLDHDESFHFFSTLNVKYKKKYEEKYGNSNFYKYIKTVTDEDCELEILLQEITGYCISNYNNAKAFFIFYGESNSGKSVFLDLLIDIIGEENSSHIELQNLSKEVYVAELVNKKINVCNELPDTDIKDLGKIKSLVSDTDKVLGCAKFKNPIYFYNKAKLVFATNNLPRIANKVVNDNSAFFNRMIIIPFIKSISLNEQDKDLINKLKEEKEIVFLWALRGLKRYIENGFKFSNCKISEQYLNRYKNRESIIEKFIAEKIIFNSNEYIFKKDLDDIFYEYCIEEDNGDNFQKAKIVLKNILQSKYSVEYRRLNRKDGNKYGYVGISVYL